MGTFKCLYKIPVVGDPGLEPNCKFTCVAKALYGQLKECWAFMRKVVSIVPIFEYFVVFSPKP